MVLGLMWIGIFVLVTLALIRVQGLLWGTHHFYSEAIRVSDLRTGDLIMFQDGTYHENPITSSTPSHIGFVWNHPTYGPSVIDLFPISYPARSERFVHERWNGVRILDLEGILTRSRKRFFIRSYHGPLTDADFVRAWTDASYEQYDASFLDSGWRFLPMIVYHAAGVPGMDVLAGDLKNKQCIGWIVDVLCRLKVIDPSDMSLVLSQPLLFSTKNGTFDGCVHGPHTWSIERHLVAN